MESLSQAKAMENDEAFLEYEVRIRHRLHSREIITREEFVKRYPDGWQPETGK